MAKRTVAQGLAAEAVRTHAVEKAKRPRRRPGTGGTTRRTPKKDEGRDWYTDPTGLFHEMSRR